MLVVPVVINVVMLHNIIYIYIYYRERVLNIRIF